MKLVHEIAFPTPTQASVNRVFLPSWINLEWWGFSKRFPSGRQLADPVIEFTVEKSLRGVSEALGCQIEVMELMMMFILLMEEILRHLGPGKYKTRRK